MTRLLRILIERKKRTKSYLVYSTLAECKKCKTICACKMIRTKSYEQIFFSPHEAFTRKYCTVQCLQIKIVNIVQRTYCTYDTCKLGYNNYIHHFWASCTCPQNLTLYLRVRFDDSRVSKPTRKAANLT